MIIFINSFILISVQSFLAQALPDYTVIKVDFDASNCSTTSLNKENSNDTKWENRSGSMQCDIEPQRVNCYVDISKEKNFHELMNTVYMIPRDDRFSANLSRVPSKISPKKHKCIMDALFNSVELSRKLSGLSKNDVKSSVLCVDPLGNATKYDLNRQANDSEKLSDRGDVAWRIPVGSNCTEFFWHGARSPNSYLEVLAIREKMLRQFNSKTIEFLCSPSSSTSEDCFLSQVKKRIPSYFRAVELVYSGGVLDEKPVDLQRIAERYVWRSEYKPKPPPDQVGSLFFAWLIAGLFVLILVVTIRLASTYEYVDEPKPLKPSRFTLKSVEKWLEKASNAPGSRTVAVQLYLDQIEEAARRRLRTTSVPEHTSTVLPPPIESSDFESVKKKTTAAAAVAQMRSLQNTQEASRDVKDEDVKEEKKARKTAKLEPASSAPPTKHEPLSSAPPTRNELSRLVAQQSPAPRTSKQISRTEMTATSDDPTKKKKSERTAVERTVQQTQPLSMEQDEKAHFEHGKTPKKGKRSKSTSKSKSTSDEN